MVRITSSGDIVNDEDIPTQRREPRRQLHNSISLARNNGDVANISVRLFLFSVRCRSFFTGIEIHRSEIGGIASCLKRSVKARKLQISITPICFDVTSRKMSIFYKH